MNFRHRPAWLLATALLVTAAIYWPGLYGSWLFDDYPNIVDNPGVQPADASLSALAKAALSSPSSEFRRPLASLSFAANYLADGLNPLGWKLVNLVLHLLNGLLVYWLARRLAAATGQRSGGWIATAVAAGWLLAPINLTGVLYVVQRMESLANLCVLLGLTGYVVARQGMLGTVPGDRSGWGRLALAAAALLAGTACGLLAKETAVLLPLYAWLVEWIVFGFARSTATPTHRSTDWRLHGLFALVLWLPLLAGLAWLLPDVTAPGRWATRDFTLGTRLLSEARVVCDYLKWTLLPTPHALSFYHDDFTVSTGLFTPWTTAASIAFLAALAAGVLHLRTCRPLVALGVALFLACHLLTATVLPLELVYEHRNYFASFGVLLAVVPWLAEAGCLGWLRRGVLAALMLGWAGLTASTAWAWGEPLRLAETLAARAPDSPRAQYELGRSCILLSGYDRASPYTALAYAPLERAAALPHGSILPQQALIFFQARLGLPTKPEWWDSMTARLAAQRPGVQDESSLIALVQCNRSPHCPLPEARMIAAFKAALSHPHPSPRVLATYGDYAWNALRDRPLGLSLTTAAVAARPTEPAYRITLARMLAAEGRHAEARQQIKALEALNYGGRLDADIAGLRAVVRESGT